jgi:acetylornithine deacetylase/succinyl-diaminopimelate desuccinylase-like protein
LGVFVPIDRFERLVRAAHAAVDGAAIADAIRLLCERPAPRGAERESARSLAAWARARWPDLGWRVDDVGPAGANLVGVSALAPAADELLFCSHLDTSLSGDAERDRWATGRSAPPAPFAWDRAAGTVAGFGLGVARAPAAAALAGYAAAATVLREAGLPHRLTLLLSGSGTHASPFAAPGEAEPETGLEAHLRAHPAPAAAVVAKCGPPGVLHEEPGAAFVRIRLETGYGPVLARDCARPPGGLLAHLGEVVAILERWRADHLARPVRPGQIAPEAGIGAVRGGLAAKPDLLPGVAELHLYVVTVPGDDVGEIAAEIRRRLERGVRDGPLAGCAIRVDAREAHPAGLTSPDAPVVRHATAAWRRAHDADPPPITGWKGSTDGVVLRGRGVPTARVGPAPRPDPSDPRRDIFDLHVLRGFAGIYAETAIRHALHRDDVPPA